MMGVENDSLRNFTTTQAKGWAQVGLLIRSWILMPSRCDRTLPSQNIALFEEFFALDAIDWALSGWNYV